MSTRCLLLVMLVLLVGSATSSRELRLEDVMTMAENHSYRLKVARAQTEAFDAGLESAIAERFPTLSATGVASYKNEVPQLDIELPTGDVFRRDFGFNETYQVDLRLSVPLYTGGRIGGGVDLARATRDYYMALEQAGIDDIVLLARVEFLSLYKAERLVGIAQSGLTRAQVTFDDVISLYNAGAADSVCILDARLAVAEAGSRLNAATSAMRQNQIRLAVLLGIDPADEIIPLLSPVTPDLDGLTFAGVSDEKPQLAASASAIRISQSAVKLNRADLFPSVALFGGYSWGKPNNDPFHDEFNDFFTVGANLNWSFNLGGKTSGSVSKAKHQLTSSQHEYEKTKEQLSENALVLLEVLQLIYDDYRTAQENFRIASANYRLANDKHREGILSSNRLIEIEESLSQAEAKLASAQADFHIVQSQYYHAIGSKLLKEGI